MLFFGSFDDTEAHRSHESQPSYASGEAVTGAVSEGVTRVIKMNASDHAPVGVRPH